jgi:Pvc16 N-terminal domain
MAGVAAIAATCEAVRHVLESAAAADDLGFEMTFRVYGPAEFGLEEPLITTGVSVFLYRVLPNLSHRTPAGRVLPDGRRHRTHLPVDLHLLLTVWAGTPETQNTIVAWLMRTLEDYPTLPASLLNINHEGTFASEESVELVLNEMPGEEILHLWEVLGRRIYQISIPYVVRALFIESQRIEPVAEPVQVRKFAMGVGTTP